MSLSAVLCWLSGACAAWAFACRYDERRERLRARTAWMESTDEMQACLTGMAEQNSRLREQNTLLVHIAHNREEAAVKRVRGQLRPSVN